MDAMLARLRWAQNQPLTWWTLALLLALAQAADVVTTALNLRHPQADERNPFAALLLAHGGWTALGFGKTALALALCGLLVAFSLTPAVRRSWTGGVALAAAALGALAYWLVIGANLGVLLLVSHVLPFLR